MDHGRDSPGETGAGLDAERRLAESIRVKVSLLVAALEPISRQTWRSVLFLL